MPGMRRLAAVLTALAAWSAGAAEPAVTGTLRVDYFHTGGQGVEIFAVDQVVLEPLPWSGHPARTVEVAETGSYRFEVRGADGKLVFSRGFSSIFGEWVTTAEATASHRTFHESLRFPVPDGPVEITVLKRNAEQVFAAAWRTTVDPADINVVRAPPPRQELIAVERNGTPADSVDPLLIGDGYTAAECAAKFPADARRVADALFRHEPYARRRSDFNIWGLCPPSAESGVARPWGAL